MRRSIFFFFWGGGGSNGCSVFFISVRKLNHLAEEEGAAGVEGGVRDGLGMGVILPLTTSVLHSRPPVQRSLTVAHVFS